MHAGRDDGGTLHLRTGAAENLTFSASPEAGEAGSVTFVLTPDLSIDPELSNNVDRVVIGDGPRRLRGRRRRPLDPGASSAGVRG